MSLKDLLDNKEDAYIGGGPDALDLLDISFIGSDGSLRWNNATDADQERVAAHLRLRFNVVNLYHAEPFVILGCYPVIPSGGRLPYSVGGLIAVWRRDDDMDFWPMLGIEGQGEDEKEVDEGLLDGFDTYKMPTDGAVLNMATKIFPDCNAVTYFYDALVIEFPLTNEQDFISNVQELPRSIRNLPLILQYHNGPLAISETHRRVRQPKPQVVADRDDRRPEDTTDYIRHDGKFYPGSMICSTTKDGDWYSTITASIAVAKKDEKRLVCSWHNWLDHDKEYPGLLGKDTDEARRVFRLCQGRDPLDDDKAGSEVGFVMDRIGIPGDIALARLHDPTKFENSFMEIVHKSGQPVTAKSLIPSHNINHLDTFQIDGYPTGLQHVTSLGRRYEIARGPESRHRPFQVPEKADPSLYPQPEVAYISVKQGLCSVEQPTQTSKPYIRNSACGSVLVRDMDRSKIKQKETKDEVLGRGECCGVVHFTDLKAKSSFAGELMMYCESFDPLIADGWTVDTGAETVGDPSTIASALANEPLSATPHKKAVHRPSDESNGPPSKRARGG